MGGFYGSKDDADAEVENLLNQLQEESILKLNVNSHRSTGSFRSGLPSSSSAEEDVASGSSDGLDRSLLVRFANLKKGKAEPSTKQQKQVVRKAQESGGSAVQGELDSRLAALKTAKPPPRPSQQQQQQKSSFSPLKLIKQLSGGKKPFKSKSSDESNSFSVEDGDWTPEHEDANKLLASVASEVKAAKKQLKKNSKKESSSSRLDSSLGMDMDDENLDLRKLKRELWKASSEQDNLAREAEKVVEWAKDAARLDPDSDGDDDEEEGQEDEDEVDVDLEELLKMEQDQEQQQQQSKTKKKKKWGLF